MRTITIALLGLALLTIAVWLGCYLISIVAGWAILPTFVTAVCIGVVGIGVVANAEYL